MNSTSHKPRNRTVFASIAFTALNEYGNIQLRYFIGGRSSYRVHTCSGYPGKILEILEALLFSVWSLSRWKFGMFM